MHLNALETLATIDREKSFSRTAIVRNMTLSAVSMQMKALEDELGAALFDRSFRPPKLTPLGQQVARDAVSMVKTYSMMRARCLPSGELTGVLQVGFVPTAAARVLPEALGRAAKAAPRARLEVTTGLSEDLCEKVRHGQLDAAVVTDIADATFDLHVDRLMREEMVVVAPLVPDAEVVSQLSKTLPFIHFVPSSGIGKLIARYHGQMQLEPKGILTLDSIEAIVRCVENGIGYSLLPRPDVVRYGGDRVRIYPCAPAPLYRDISLATREDALAEIWRPPLLSLLRQA